MFARNLLSVGVAGALLAAAPVGAEAGGLFGKGGLIRGDVGNWLDKHVEQPILTPVAQTAVVVASTAVAVTYAGPVGAPVGLALGNGINDSFAGGKGGEQKQAAAPPQQQVAMGTNCATDVIGVLPLGGPAPLGSQCTVKLQNGKEFGGKVAQ